MNRVSRILIMLTMVSAIFGCKKDDEPTPDNPMAAYIKTATYKLVVDGTTAAEGSCNGVSSYPGVEEDNTVVLFKGDVMHVSGDWVVASATGIPYTTGDEAGIDYSNIGVAFFNVGAEKKLFMAKTGVIVRTANNKITFSGVGYYSGNVDDEKEFSGSITSEVIKSIKNSTTMD